MSVVLVGPDTKLVLPRAGVTASEAKEYWSNVVGAPVDLLSLSRGDDELDDESVLADGEEVKVLYTLQGGGCSCDGCKFNLEKNFPKFCACGYLCGHCWCVSCGEIQQMVMAQKACCSG